MALTKLRRSLSTGRPRLPFPDLGAGTRDLIWLHSSSLRSVGYFVGCVCIRTIYDRVIMLYNISNLLRISLFPFLKHALTQDELRKLLENATSDWRTMIL